MNRTIELIRNAPEMQAVLRDRREAAKYRKYYGVFQRRDFGRRVEER